MSFDLNNAVIAGRLAADPEVRTIPGEKALTAASYRVAVNRRRKDGQEAQADFITCESFGVQAEFLKNYMRKGAPLLVEGVVRTKTYDDKAGVHRYETKVLGNRVSSEKDGNLNWNTVQLAGRLTRNPEMRVSNAGSGSVAKFTLAVDRNTKNKAADFITCACFGKMAESASTYLSKGKGVCIRGRLQTGDYVNKDGIRVYTTEVIVEDFRFTKTKAGSAGAAAPVQAPQADAAQFQAQQAVPAMQEMPVQAAAPQAPQEVPASMDDIFADTGLDGFVNIPDGLDDLGELPFD